MIRFWNRRKGIRSDPSLFTSKTEQIIHELAEARSVHKIIKFNVEHLQEIMKRDSEKIKRLEDEVDKYIIKGVKPKKENLCQ